MDSTTLLLLVAGVGLLAVLVSVACAVVAVRSTRRRTAEHLDEVRRVQHEMTRQVALVPVRAQRSAAEPVDEEAAVTSRHDVVRVDVAGEIVDAVLVEDPNEATSRALAEPADPQTTRTERHIDGRLFADLVLRESLVKGVALAHGVRHALSAQTRNRIQFEMRREVKRSRRQRKDEVRIAVREYRARQRARLSEDDDQ